VADYFLDSSAIVKRYVTEPGSGVVDSILAPEIASTRYIAETAIVEVIAALHRRSRRAEVGDGGSSQIARFRHELPRLASIVAVSGEVIQFASELAARRILRGYDAVQLAAACVASTERVERGSPPLVMVSSDVELNAAAVAEGLDVLDPTG
jgi:uncharacterized protein